MAAIDILMPVRNGIRFLGESIESILAQTYPDWRLLILDHGSTDGSTEMAMRYAGLDRRIHVLPMPGARDLGSLLNAGLDRCDARYVMRHDADDIALPNRMEVMNAFYAANPQYVAVGGDSSDDRRRRRLLSTICGRRPGRKRSPRAASSTTP